MIKKNLKGTNDSSVNAEERTRNKMVLQKGELPIGFRSIRMRLIASFFIPVILIVALGVVSYSKASDGIITNYEASRWTY